MSVPKDRLFEIINNLEDNQTSKVIDFIESLNKKHNAEKKPSDFFGIWKNLNVDVEKICDELRGEWDRNIL